MRRLPVGVAAAACVLCGPGFSFGTRSADGAGLASCPVSHVHYRPYKDQGAGLRLVPWIATAPSAAFSAHLFFYGATPWSRRHLLGARIFTAAAKRNVNPKVLWIARRPGAGRSISISGSRLDRPGRFEARYPRALSGSQFPSYVEVPQAGCWRVTVRSGRLVGRVVFAAVDPY
ncbi:MAG: hypothetical protein ACRDM1_08600 [Gaiellaceae bacterium]